AARQDGWRRDSEAAPEGLCFVREEMSLRIVFLTAELLKEYGHGTRPDLTTGAGYWIRIDANVNSGSEAGC
ncbi:hypothetical protein G3M55_51325, partial [Streptomyces sp. SID8455]|nr:hypothetical protein [Streptomyces sp. SID8455]